MEAARLRSVFTSEKVKPAAAGSASQEKITAKPASVAPTNCTIVTALVKTSAKIAERTDTSTPIERTAHHVSQMSTACAAPSSSRIPARLDGRRASAEAKRASDTIAAAPAPRQR